MRITNDGSIDPTFTLNNGTNPIKVVKVRSLALQSDNKLIVGGSFTSYLGAAKNRIVRLESNGTVDNTFNIGTGFNGEVYCVKIQSDGKIIVGGNFTSFNGVPRSRIARLNSDGSLDTTFNINYTVDKIVRVILIQPDGKVLIGGDFDIVGECVVYDIPTGVCSLYNTRSRIARLNANGSLDTNFLNYFSSSSDRGFKKIFPYDGSNIATVRTISEYSTGKYFIGGHFDTYNGVSRNNICLLDTNATLETSFNPSPGPDGGVLGSIVEPSGNVVIVGSFWEFNSVIKNGITRVSPAGVALKMSNETVAEQVLVASLEKELNKNEDQLTGLKVFPNPADNILNINSERMITKISLTDLNGRIVKEMNQNKTTHSVLDISELAKGIYLMQIDTENGSVNKKIIKN